MTPSEHRVLVVVGTRPEAIKMAPVLDGLRAHAPDIRPRVAFTGQHTTLVDQVLTAFDMTPDDDLAIMKPGQSLYDVVHGVLDGLKDVVASFRPHMVLVQGDTATVFVGALVAFFEGVMVGHVEAGLRSGDKKAPFPEEVLRRLTDVIADVHFAPTRQAGDLLARELSPADELQGGGRGGPARVHVTGTTVVDALQRVAALDRPIGNEVLRRLTDDPARRLVLLTAHRRESFGAPIREVFGAVRALADRVPDIHILYPVHPNPNVREPAEAVLADHPRVHLTEPLDYFDLVAALRRASLVLTDSGGIQEEAPTFGAHVLVLREVTERPEGVEAGVAELVGTDAALIVARGVAALEGGSPPKRANPYGDGQAGVRIADIVMATLTGRPRATRDWDG
mgnify:CR=1 FL=1